MSEEQVKDLVENDYGAEVTSDQLASLFVSEDAETDSQVAPEVDSNDSVETATTETETQETEQPSEEESVSTEEDDFDDLVFVHNDTEYSNDDLALAVEALQNKDEWQKANTQKAQQIAEERKQ